MASLVRFFGIMVVVRCFLAYRVARVPPYVPTNTCLVLTGFTCCARVFVCRSARGRLLFLFCQEGGAEVPMWTPPFPPEEFDEFDDETGMESQASGLTTVQRVLMSARLRMILSSSCGGCISRFSRS